MAKLDRLDLLGVLFHRILVPETVAEERTRDANRFDAQRTRTAMESAGIFETLSVQDEVILRCRICRL